MISQISRFSLFQALPRSAFALLLTLLLISGATALPDDKNQQLIIDSSSQKLDLEQGIMTYFGSSEKPVVVTQGSLKISGSEIILERGSDGEIDKIIAYGSPAEFQHQPEIDKAIVYANGQIVTLDNILQFLIIDGSAEFIQGAHTITGPHIDYDIVTKIANATSSPSGEQVRVVITPNTN